MKPSIKPNLAAFIAASLLALSHTAPAAITGQWDFKRGDLTATIGGNIQYLDSAAVSGAKFGTTTSFGISPIGGVPTNVMQFPQFTDELGGFGVPVGAAANGGGGNVNEYTIIMDVLFPTNSSFLPRALFVSDSTAADFLADQNNAIGFAGNSFDGDLTSNTWHRVAVTVDTAGAISKFIDGVQVGTDQATPGGLDGGYSISSQIFLFDDANTNSQLGYIASLQFQDQKLPAGLIAALGAPVATGILTGPPPNPYVVSEAPTDDLRFPGRAMVPPNPTLSIVLSDGVTTVNTNSIQLKFNGTLVPASFAKAGALTTISYNVTNLLAAATTNTVVLSYKDSATNSLGVQYAFVVGPYIALPVAAAGPPGSAGTNGFIFRMVQAPAEATGVILQDNYVRAEQQLDGTLLNTNGVAFTNEAVLGPNPDGSYFVDVYNPGDVIAFELTGSALNAFPSATIQPFPGIPGVNGSTDNFADETLAYLSLTAGSYVFGVDVGIERVDSPPGADDGYRLYCGANPRDQFSTLVGEFVRTGNNFTDTQNTNTFTFVAPVTGLYPFRLVHWQNNQGANLAWYSVDPATGDLVLINDPTDARSIKAYRVSSIAREPYIAEIYPVPGGEGFAANAPLEIVLGDDNLAVNQSSIQLSLNGTLVTPNSISKSGTLTTITYNPNASRTAITNTVQLVYSDNATTPHSFTNSWSFTIVAGGTGAPAVTGQWDFNSGNLMATVGKDLQYLDGPSGQSASMTHFGTCSSFGIPTINGVDAAVMQVPAANGINAFGYIMDHQIAPNGGGQLVNQYTIIWDMYYIAGTTLPMFNCQNTNNTTDGSIFLQNGDLGQGSGGYAMKSPITTGWHRVALATDLASGVITKWVDGVKQQDWAGQSLDAPRRAWQHTVLLFADGDGDDHTGICYVKSIQVRNGKLSDAEMVALGGISSVSIPEAIPATSVTGQWDFNSGDLTATVGKDLQYLDGTNGQSASMTHFGTCSSFGIPTINGVDAAVMQVPAANGINAFGYIMDHQIAPNGGGQLVNQYTIIWDMYYIAGTTLPMFNCQNTNNTTDGSIFLQNGDLGQGSGGYVMKSPITTGWHRVALATDLASGVITKWVDGVKQQDWAGQSLDAPRRAWQHTVLLFADGDGDDHTGICYVKSIQVHNGKLSDAEMVALGGISSSAIPVETPVTSVTGQWDFNSGDLTATVGKDLQYLDGTNGQSALMTHFGTCTSFGIPTINGVDAPVMQVPAANGINAFGYIMDHQIAPNGGGQLVNQYTIIWDMYYIAGTTLPMFNCQNTNNTTDGSIFLQNGDLGQGSGGYVMKSPITTGWHRVALATDLASGVITKWVDGVKQQDWAGQSLDAPRRAWQHTVLLFADGDGDDHTGICYVKSIQVHNGKLSDAEMVALGGISSSAIPVETPATSVTGQWDFNSGDLTATVGKDLQYLDGTNGQSASMTHFGTCSNFGISTINGVDAPVMQVPAANGINAFGYIMDHQIAPNGGGQLVNQYTIIWDMYYIAGTTLPLFNCQNTNNTTDGSIFLQNGDIGQGSGGYVMLTPVSTGWHRIGLATDLASGVITKWVDGVKQQDWTGQSLDAARRAWQHTVLLFADGDGDDHTGICYVKSIQVSNGKLDDASMIALGGPSSGGIPVVIPSAQSGQSVSLALVRGTNSLTLSWPPSVTGFVLESTASLSSPSWQSVAGVTNNSVTVPIAPGDMFFRLRLP